MNIHLLLATIFLVGAAVLLYFGYTTSQSSGVEEIQETFTDRFIDSTSWYVVLGVGAVICGAILLTFWVGI